MNNNPFTPNFGQIPMVIAGREQIISEVIQALGEGPGNPSRTSILVGARGTGKTSLLTYFADEGSRRGWISINVSCIEGMQEDILQQVLLSAENYITTKNSKHLKGVSVGQIISLEWENGQDINWNWRSKITKILNELEKEDIGLLITIDEATPDLDEMVQVASVYQHLLREGHKVAMLMAGLPSEVSDLLNDRSVSFLRRANKYTLGRIEDYEIESAFNRTIVESDKTINQDALDAAVEAIAGFPYMLQLVGYRTWEEAGDKESIDLGDVEKGIYLAKKDFESRVLSSTVRELSAGDLMFLKAMADSGDVAEIADIQEKMGKGSGYVSQYRARLIERGVVEQAGRGKLEFSLPGMREYIRTRV